jgi:hypothetical protein
VTNWDGRHLIEVTGVRLLEGLILQGVGIVTGKGMASCPSSSSLITSSDSAISEPSNLFLSLRISGMQVVLSTRPGRSLDRIAQNGAIIPISPLLSCYTNLSIIVSFFGL